MANPLNIFGIPIRHCINGITKDDKINIDSIPSLDERINALEQNDGTVWTTVDYASQTSIQFAYSFFNYGTSEKYFKKDTIIKYHVFDSAKGYDILLFFPKGSKFNSFGVNFTRKYTDDNNINHYFIGTRYFENTNEIMDLGGDLDGRVNYKENGIEIMDDNGTITFAYRNTSGYVHYDELPITFYYRN